MARGGTRELVLRLLIDGDGESVRVADAPPDPDLCRLLRLASESVRPSRSRGRTRRAAKDVEDIRRTVAVVLAAELEPTLAQVSETLGIHERTIERRLARVGLVLGDLVPAVRLLPQLAVDSAPGHDGTSVR